MYCSICSAPLDHNHSYDQRECGKCMETARSLLRFAVGLLDILPRRSEWEPKRQAHESQEKIRRFEIERQREAERMERAQREIELKDCVLCCNRVYSYLVWEDHKNHTE